MRDAASERVLVIHADRETGSRIARPLEQAGYAVEVAADGLEGLLAARRLRPAVVLCDASAPRLGAIDFCRTIRHEPGLVATFVIALASSPTADDRATTLDAGADDLLAGPLEDEALVASVRAGLRGRVAARAETSAKRREETLDRAAALAADVNNALMALVGHLALVRQYLERAETPRAQAHVDDARRAAERIADATQGFLVECERAAATDDRV